MFSYFLRNEKLNSWIANNDKKAEKKVLSKCLLHELCESKDFFIRQ